MVRTETKRIVWTGREGRDKGRGTGEAGVFGRVVGVMVFGYV